MNQPRYEDVNKSTLMHVSEHVWFKVYLERRFIP